MLLEQQGKPFKFECLEKKSSSSSSSVRWLSQYTFAFAVGAVQWAVNFIRVRW